MSNAVIKLIKSTRPPKIKIFSKEQVEKSSFLIIINDWEKTHPVGNIIKKYVGKDATKIFKNIHPEYAYNLLECLYVGSVE
jgi:hypothetical protein